MKAIVAALVSMLAVAGCATETAPSVEVKDEPHLACTLPCITIHEVRLPATITNQTYRSTSEVTPIVLGAIRDQLHTSSSFDVDEGRDPTTSPNALELLPRLSSISYHDGSLTVAVVLNIFRYPSMSLVGTISQNVTKPGVTPLDVASENQLIDIASTNATERFMDDIASFQ